MLWIGGLAPVKDASALEKLEVLDIGMLANPAVDEIALELDVGVTIDVSPVVGEALAEIAFSG